MCETAARLTGTDGAAVAVLTARAQVRELVHATDALAQQIDELQFTIGEGPCLDAHQLNEPQLHPELLGDGHAAVRWPVFTAEIIALGVRAVFAFPVPGALGPQAVLELYRRSGGALGDNEHHFALTCADAIARTLQFNWDTHLSAAQSTQAAIDAVILSAADPHRPADPFTRSQIHVAAGMVAVQAEISVGDALDLLRAYSFSHQQTLTAVAAEVIERRLSFREHREEPKDQ
ncbi:hypothetical protein MKCMC460_32180 [Mycobacterium sp. 20KCMC460]|uniref:ANTAR domain-containing protein n=2 Tax=Mycobacteriaceae TaxID=1762 RepID=A0A9P3Q2E7_9MYCO|nr:hypothetical protein MKCMC460_32180 [Mycobacterium sp. 20KCMC460]GLB83299.1 hypothetical protein SRL2020028_25550 [Mycobacterium kiyosense]GLB93180.1 hypothetical protein SRL2020130_59970 [Mycobacterium kiyosense]GLB98535.1 hypothetical protein SRL2020226_53110 [Mycobacterium kiyosense]GLC03150.1 hypothetical protein SRL2020400_37410 [Mycobacterium kiyosense]